MSSDPTGASARSGFVLTEDGGNAFWFLNTLTINKIESEHTHGGFTIVDHRVPAGFAPPPHVHAGVDEAFYILDGEFEGFCGDTQWRAGPGAVVFLPGYSAWVPRIAIRSGPNAAHPRAGWI